MSPVSPAVVLGVLLLLLQEGVNACSNVSALSQQLDGVLAEYDRESAPASPARVRLALDLRHATLRDDDTLHLLADFTMMWQDPRIFWNASEWDCDSVLTSPYRLWLPSVELLNGVGVPHAALSVRVASDGRLSWAQRLDVTVPVALTLRNWPADVQTAVIKFGSRTQSIDELDLEISDMQLAVVFEAGAWEMLSLTGALSSAGAGARRVAAWTVRLRRRAAAHRAAAGAVLAAVTLLLLAAAATPARTRGPLCACASFTAALWFDTFCTFVTTIKLVSAAVRVPGGGGAAPTAVCVVGALCAGAAAAAAAAALAARVASLPHQPPRALRTLASTLSRWCTVPTGEERAQAQVEAWAALGALLDRALVAAWLLGLFVCLCVYI